MARRRKRSRSKAPARIRILIGLLVFVLVAGIAALKFLETPRGSVFLLSKGFFSHYSRAQEHIGTGILDALGRAGLGEGVTSKRFIVELDNERSSGIEYHVPCDEQTDLIGVNLAITRAVGGRGGNVLRSEELEEGTELYMEVGAGRRVTHRIVIEKRAARGERAPERARPRLALVIDDFGYSFDEVTRAFLETDLALTFSVIPSLSHSKDILEEAPRHGKEVILHLPMEPEGEYGGGVGEVTTSMTDEEIRVLVEEYLDGMPGVIGVNNHMGSKATGDERVMGVVLGVLKRRGLFFLDSLTSPRSVAYTSARSMEVGAARNDLFLDDDTRDPVLIEQRLVRLLGKARKSGEAIGIGHPRPWTLEVLESNKERMLSSDVELVFLSELVK